MSSVPTVRLGTNLRLTLGAHRSDARSQLVKATDLDFSRSVFCLGWHVRKTCTQHVLLSRYGCAVGALGVKDALEALGNARLKSEKIRYILPKLGKESVDLPVFVKDSVAVLQIL